MVYLRSVIVIMTRILLNGEIGPFFQTRKGFHKGDPLSAILLNIVAICWQF
jgi:hypothetical protein